MVAATLTGRRILTVCAVRPSIRHIFYPILKVIPENGFSTLTPKLLNLSIPMSVSFRLLIQYCSFVSVSNERKRLFSRCSYPLDDRYMEC